VEYVIAWCGFVGGWLLFAGPIYQGALELQDEEVDRDAFDRHHFDSIQPPKISAWWWLLPPVAWLKHQRRNRDFQQAVMHSLTAEQRGQFVSFSNKATGWFIVGAGAALIAVKETWELVEQYEWPIWAFVVLLVLPPVLGVVFVSLRLRVSRQVLESEA
jgi:hypothetical protein